MASMAIYSTIGSGTGVVFQQSGGVVKKFCASC